MSRSALLLQTVLSLAFLLLEGTLWVLMIVQGDDAWFGWRRSFEFAGLYLDMYAFLLVNVTVIPVVVLSLWRTLQMWGLLPEREGVRWANRILLSMAVGCLLVVVLRWHVWNALLGGDEANRPKPPDDSALEYPSLPLAPETEFSWELHDPKGNAINVASLKGKTIFLNIWATWCGYCKLEFPNIQNLRQQLKDNPDIIFLLVTDEKPDVVQKWLASDEGKAFDLPFYTTEKIPHRFEPSGYPTTFIIGPGGDTVFEHSGFVAWDGDTTKDFLKHLAAGTPWTAPEKKDTAAPPS